MTNPVSGKVITSGFKSHNYEVKQFEAVGKLGYLGLGFFNDINISIYKGGFEITFTRNNDNSVIYRWKEGDNASTLPTEGKIEIKTFYSIVPIIEFNSETKFNLIGELIKNNYFFQFKNGCAFNIQK